MPGIVPPPARQLDAGATTGAARTRADPPPSLIARPSAVEQSAIAPGAPGGPNGTNRGVGPRRSHSSYERVVRTRRQFDGGTPAYAVLVVMRKRYSSRLPGGTASMSSGRPSPAGSRSWNGK